MTDLFTIGKQALAAPPFSHLLGTELIEFSAERVELIVPITNELKQLDFKKSEDWL